MGQVTKALTSVIGRPEMSHVSIQGLTLGSSLVRYAAQVRDAAIQTGGKF